MRFNRFQKIAFTSVGITLFLIFLGGLVRVSGSGLGCPDWPRCFGLWIPPTSAAQLPAGFEAGQFNVYRTWTEYINRLFGVMTGLSILLTFGMSFTYREKIPSVFYSSGAALLLVIFQAWLGGMVVRSELMGWLVTAHLLVAFVIVNLLIYAAFKANPHLLPLKLDDKLKKNLFAAGMVLLGITLVQVVLGTQLREAVDLVKARQADLPREEWLGATGWLDNVHRTFSLMVLAAGSGLLYLTFREIKRTGSALIKLAGLILGLILFQLVLGIGMAYIGMPPSYQVLHLFTAAMLVSAECYFLIAVRVERPVKKQPVEDNKRADPFAFGSA